MRLQIRAPKGRTREAVPPLHSPCELRVSRLTDADRDEVLEFLTARIIHSFGLLGFVRRNGLSSPENRGTFYAYRDAGGRLEGVALIGHATLIEARGDAAIVAFARQAQECRDVFMLFAQ